MRSKHVLSTPHHVTDINTDKIDEDTELWRHRSHELQKRRWKVIREKEHDWQTRPGRVQRRRSIA